MAGHFEIKRAKDGQYFFKLVAGDTTLMSEMYKQRASAENGIASVKKNSPDDARYDRRTSNSDQPYFVLKAGNGEVIGTSGMYASDEAMASGIEALKQSAADAEVRDETQGS